MANSYLGNRKSYKIIIMDTIKNGTVEAFFYAERDSKTRVAAKEILEIVILCFGKFKSVVDIGCGVGTWLSVAGQLGAEKCMGF